MKIQKLLPCLLAFATLPVFAGGADAVPKKVGPVSYYGALHTSGSKIIGAKNNQQALLRGMSLFWSDATGLPYYKKDVINWAVDNLKMDVFRFAMGITCYSSTEQRSNGCVNSSDSLFSGYSYATSPDSYKAIVDKMVQAAVENDVYIIIDWHSHRAEYEQAMAKSFFSEISAKYKDVPNVIYEIYNEPVHTGWGTITSYANDITGAIRKNTENLVLVGTPNWSQLTNYGGVNGTNVGYVFHFYAATHKKGSFSGNIDGALNSGNPVFVTEWGTVAADGKGTADASATNEWLSYLDSKGISNCNWSLRQTGGTETSAMFDGSDELTSQGLLASAKYSSSGSIVSSYLKKNGRTWADSLTKGKRSGSCAFNHTSAKETDGQVTGVLKSGCTYTSSNPAVVEISGTNLTIKGAGFSILKGNDGTESVVTINEVASQTIPNFATMYCRYNDAETHPCSIGRGANYTNSNSSTATFDWILGQEKKTLEGASYTITSLNPDIVEVKSAACKNNTYCSSTQKEAGNIVMYAFKKFGTAKIVATAPAVAGYRALNDTIEVTYRKGENKFSNKFTDQKIAIAGASAAGTVPSTTLLKTPITYTFNCDGTGFTSSCSYLAIANNAFMAGPQNAIIDVMATADETDVLEKVSKTVRVIVGDSASAVNLKEMALPSVKTEMAGLSAQFSNNGLMVNALTGKTVKVSVFDANGKAVVSKRMNMNLGTRWISLEELSAGSYMAKISQGSKSVQVKFIKE